MLCPSAASCAPGQRSHSPVEYPRPIGDFYVKLCSWASGELALDPWEPVRLLLTVGGGLRGRGRPWVPGQRPDVLRPASGCRGAGARPLRSAVQVPGGGTDGGVQHEGHTCGRQPGLRMCSFRLFSCYDG